MLIQILFSVRSERQLMQELDFNLLYRWFVGLSMDDEVWNHSTFSKNRDRLLVNDVADRFFEAIKGQAAAKKLLSKDHFTVDGTLIEASASLKSFRPKDAPPSDDDGPGGGVHEVAGDVAQPRGLPAGGQREGRRGVVLEHGPLRGRPRADQRRGTPARLRPRRPQVRRGSGAGGKERALPGKTCHCLILFPVYDQYLTVDR